MSIQDLEEASVRAGQIAQHLGLVRLAAEALRADEAMIAGPHFYAAATSLEEQVTLLSAELYRLAEEWQQERSAAKAK
jgi:hypothetical protein